MKCIFIIGLLSFCFSYVSFQGTPVNKSVNYIQGKVIDKKTKEPLNKATIQILNSRTGVLADARGNYRLSIPDSLLGKKIRQ